MAQKAQIRARRLSAVMIGWIAIALAVPTGAWAGSDSSRHSWNTFRSHNDHRGHDRYRNHDDRRGSDKYRGGHDYRHESKRGSKKYDRDHRSNSHRYSRHDYGWRDYGRYDYGRHHRNYNRGHRNHSQSSRYFCKPCNHYFGSRTSLYHHVGDHHNVPFWRLANALVYTTLGLIFYG